ATGIHAAASRSTCSIRPVQSPKGSGCPTRESPLTVDAADLKTRIADRARTLGFDAIGFTWAALAPEIGAGLELYLEAGSHGDMDWLARDPERRRHPKGLWPEARSVIVLGMNYGPADDPLVVLERKDRAAISVYAQGKDYHDVVKRRLK